MHWVNCVTISLLFLGGGGLFLSLLLGTEEASKMFYASVIELSVAFLLLVFLISQHIAISNKEYKRDEPYVVHQIISFVDNYAMNGNFHMGSGQIDEVHRYSYFYQTSNGDIKSRSLNANKVTVFLDDREAPRAEWYAETRSFGFLSQTRYTCDIYLPEDALVSCYEMDLK